MFGCVFLLIRSRRVASHATNDPVLRLSKPDIGQTAATLSIWNTCSHSSHAGLHKGASANRARMPFVQSKFHPPSTQLLDKQSNGYHSRTRWTP